MMDDCVALIRLAARETGTTQLRWGRSADPFAGPERLPVADAFRRYAGIELLETIGADGSTDAAALADELRRVGIAVPAEYTWSYLFTRVLVDKVEPELGNGRITILDRYPAPEAALARAPDDPRVAERFRGLCAGVELANGFGE